MSRAGLRRRGFILEGITLAWNVAGVAVLAIAAVLAGSVALGGFGLDSLIEIGASTVVIWELSGTGPERQRAALRVIGVAFCCLAGYLAVQSTFVLVVRYHPRPSPLGISWTAITALVMFALAAGKRSTGRQLGNLVLQTEGRVTLVDALLAAAVLIGLLLNAAIGWWWADPLAGYVILVYGLKEGRAALRGVAALLPSPSHVPPGVFCERTGHRGARPGLLRRAKTTLAITCAKRGICWPPALSALTTGPPAARRLRGAALV